MQKAPSVPNEKGHEVWVKAMEPELKRMLGEK
jgi:hypothetical protein